MSIALLKVLNKLGLIEDFESDIKEAKLSMEKLRDEEIGIKIETDKLIVKAWKSPFRLSFLDKTGRVITKEQAGVGYDTGSGRIYQKFHLSPDEHFYGSNARIAPLDMRGGEIFVHENYFSCCTGTTCICPTGLRASQCLYIR